MTGIERRYVSRMVLLGCIVCRRNGHHDTPAECHHIRSGITGAALRSTWYRTLPLCPIHHRQGDGTSRFEGEVGYHVSPQQFAIRYGSQEELLVEVLHLLGEDTTAGRFLSQVVK